MPTYDLPSSFNFDDPRVQLMLEKVIKRGTRVSSADVAQSRTLHFIAEWYAARYDGRFDFMCQMRDLINADRDLSVNQMAGVINCLVHDASKRKPSKLEELPADLPAAESPQITIVHTVDPVNQRIDSRIETPGVMLPPGTYTADQRWSDPVTLIVKNGTYTIVLNEAGDYRTLRVEFVRGVSNNRQVVSLLNGPNNERDFVDFAWLTGATIDIWREFRGDLISAQALKVLVSATEDRRADMGTAYAIESGRCCRCGRKLTVPASLFRGMGPDCASKG